MTTVERVPLGHLLRRAPRYGINAAAVPLKPGVPTYIRITDIDDNGRFAPSPKVGVVHPSASNYVLRSGELVFARTGASVGKSYLYDFRDGQLVYAGFLINVVPDPKRLNPKFLALYTQTKEYWDWILRTSVRSGQPGVNGREIATLLVPLPDITAQNEIAVAVGDVDQLIRSLERLIVKKQAIKQGLMQALLTGRTRLPGFSGTWAERSLGDIAAILDNLRIPLSAAQRGKRRGVYPYCGANGVLDYIDDFMINDDVILLAEDGGNFDQWQTRPIAYRMRGKIWVNNHAHVLKSTDTGDTGFLFYTLQHKDITPFISSGTRSKLTRGELVRVTVLMPSDAAEQKAIAEVLTDADTQIEALQGRLAKAHAMKTGMMQQLLTGRTRLPVEAV